MILVRNEDELWDRDQIATYLGIKRGSVSAWLGRRNIRMVAHGPVFAGQAKSLFSAEEVRAGKAAMRRS